jgi:hypothetical protein
MVQGFTYVFCRTGWRSMTTAAVAPERVAVVLLA